MRRITLLAVLALAACSPSTKPPVVVDQSAISREQAIQERMAAAPTAESGQAMGSSEYQKAQIRLARNSAPLCPKTATFSGDAYCAIYMREIDDKSVNAFAKDETVYVTTGMLGFLRSEDELALVLGHEMAHIILGHQGKKAGNSVLGAIIGGAIGGALGVDLKDAGMAAGRGTYSQSFETEADYLGMILAARAGYNVATAPALWRRMAMANPTAIHSSFSSTHPSSVERFLNLEAAAQEIERKRAAGLPLVPEMR